MLKEVVIECEVVDVIPRGGRPKGNINNRYNMEDCPNNTVIVAYNLIKHQYSSMEEILITKDKDSRAHPQMRKYTTIGTTVTHTDLM